VRRRRQRVQENGGCSGQRAQRVNIHGVDTTGDSISGRGGLNLFVRYLYSIGILESLGNQFSRIRRSAKGQAVEELFKQVFCFFLDGSGRHLTRFDHLKKDDGYAAVIETCPQQMASSHAIKRFFKAFGIFRTWAFRGVLQKLFIWRLKHTKPSVIRLYLDSMVMNNDDANQRHGSQPTYKNVNGFHPLQLIWDRFIIDAVFRGGKKHSNNGNTAAKMIARIVELIRGQYRPDVPIVVHMDAGFFDQKLFGLFDELRIGFSCSGKWYDDTREFAAALMKQEPDATYDNGQQKWRIWEFGNRRGSWSKFYRVLLCQPLRDGPQLLLPFARPDTLIYTNLEMGRPIDQQLSAAGHDTLTCTKEVIRHHHRCGADELVHRALKEFASETLPFKRFPPNAAFYYTIVVAFALYESFKEDVCAGVIPLRAYPNTLRRRIIDIAAKIASSSRRRILKVSKAVWNELNFEALWWRSGDASSLPALL